MLIIYGIFKRNDINVIYDGYDWIELRVASGESRYCRNFTLAVSRKLARLQGQITQVDRNACFITAGTFAAHK